MRVRVLVGALALTLAPLPALAASGPRPVPAHLICASPTLIPALDLAGKAHRVAGLTPKQTRRLRTLAGAGQVAGLPARAQAVAIAAWLGTHDPDIARAQVGHGWGDVTDAEFYQRLRRIDDWRLLAPSVAAHRVLGTPDPYVFADFWNQALSVLAGLTGRSPLDVASQVAVGAGLGLKCYAEATDPQAFPLPAGTGYELVDPRSKQGRHTNPAAGAASLVDAPCGTPVLAAASGVVQVRKDVRASGPWLLTIAQQGGPTTSYSHIGRPDVDNGSPVVVGQQIATVGDYGDVDQCALGFGLQNGGAAETAAATVTWLAGVAKPNLSHLPPSTTLFRMASLNVLGSHLSEPGQKDAGYAPGPVRMRAALAMLDRAQAGIVTFQEFETPAADVVTADPDWGLLRATPNNVFHDGNTNGNAIAWRKDQWDLVSSSEFTVPWRVTLHMPVALLRDKQTRAEVVVVGVHNPATTHRQGDQSAARAVARSIEITQVKAIAEQTKLPVIISGDFNEHAPVTCAFTQAGLVVWSSGGSCADASHGGVDHIFGYGSTLKIEDLYVDRSPQGSITDHPVVYSDVELDPLPDVGR